MGRIAYRWLTGRPPQAQETRTALSCVVHWVLSLLMAGGHGAVRAVARQA